MVFTTHVGHLYLIAPGDSGKASVIDVGSAHPNGDAYMASLFQYADTSLVAGVVQRQGRFEWLVYDLSKRLGGVFPLDTADLQKVLLYGSIARDNAGRAYVRRLGRTGRGRTATARPADRSGAVSATRALSVGAPVRRDAFRDTTIRG